MGAALCPTSGTCNLDTGGRCSSGVPITVNGTETEMTAGHCTSGNYFNNGALIGTTDTTSYPGNANIYGDWKLLSGDPAEDYALRTYSGGLSDQTNLIINGAHWSNRPIGAGFCSSGSTTGQICRYFVTASTTTVSISNVTTGRLTRLRHDSTGGSGYDTAGFRPGDSGGPCYCANGTGNVAVGGIITGYNTSNLLHYYCTQLSGVRAWNSGAALG